MSHVALYKSELKNVNINLIKIAIEAIAREENVEVSKHTGSYRQTSSRQTLWEGKTIIGSLFTPTITQGLGLVLNNKGALEFVGDAHQRGFGDLCRRIENAYKKLALIQSLRKMGYEVNIQEVRGNTVLEAKQ